MKLQTLFAVVAGLAACSEDLKEPSPPIFDPKAPRVQITSPARGTIAGDVSRVLVTGTASDDSGVVASVTVNGVRAALAADGTWSAEVAVTPGTSLLRAIALDAQGNQGAQTRAVVAGPMVGLDRRVPEGIRATLSAQALTSLAGGTATFIEAGGLMTAVEGRNPVVAVGGGPDCLYSHASITSVTVGDADVQMKPTTGGIAVAAVLDDVRIGMHLQWAVSCVDGSRDVVLTAQRVSVQGLLAVGVVDRELDIQLDDPDVQVTGFDLQLPDDVPDTIAQMLSLDTAMSVVLGAMTERLVVPMVDRSLSALDKLETIDVAGVQVDVAVQPAQINFTAQGGTIALDTTMRAHGDQGQFVFVPNLAPTFSMEHGFELAVADDAANQLLTSLWSAKAFDTTMHLEAGTYGEVSKLYDSVEFQLVAPPHVDANGSPLELTIGEWIATFKRDDVPALTVAIHAQSALYAVEDDDGKLRMDVSTPTVTLDILEDAISISKTQYASIKLFAFERIDALGSAAVAAIPLPAVGDATLANLWIDPKAGYLLIAGDVQ